MPKPISAGRGCDGESFSLRLLLTCAALAVLAALSWSVAAEGGVVVIGAVLGVVDKMRFHSRFFFFL